VKGSANKKSHRVLGSAILEEMENKLSLNKHPLKNKTNKKLATKPREFKMQSIVQRDAFSPRIFKGKEGHPMPK
jgi:hypothetical protein